MIKKLQKNASILRCCCHKKIPPQSINALPFIIRSRYRKTALCLIADARLSKIAFLSEFSNTVIFYASISIFFFLLASLAMFQNVDHCVAIAVSCSKALFSSSKKAPSEALPSLLNAICQLEVSILWHIWKEGSLWSIDFWGNTVGFQTGRAAERRAEADVMALEIWIFQKPACPRIDCCL